MSFRDVIQRHRHKVVPTVVLLAAALGLAFAWRPLVGWFQPLFASASPVAPAKENKAGARPKAHSAVGHAAHDALSSVDLGDEARHHLTAAFDAYDRIRALLAADTVEGIEPHARTVQTALQAAQGALPPGASEASERVDAAIAVADALAGDTDLAHARHHFSQLSEQLIGIAAMDTQLPKGWHIFRCPMAKGFPKWFQRGDAIENPYMGTKMLTCGNDTDWTTTMKDQPSARASGGTATQASTTPAEHEHGSDIAYWTCPMHPSVQEKGPGKCPICGMTLTPVTRQQVQSGVMFVDAQRRQLIGVATAKIEARHLTLPIRAVGEVKYDETQLHDVNLRMSGWVQKLFVDESGQKVRRGQTLFTLYSPELYAAELEYLNALDTQRAGSLPSTLASTQQSLVRSARTRLALLGMGDAQIDALAKGGKAEQNVPIFSPASGYVIEKNVVEGARVQAGQLVYRIADLDRVWIDAQVYESDLPYISQGQKVDVTLPYVPDETYPGTVDYIYPTLDAPTRTARVRIVLQNPDLALKPSMYANVQFQVDLGEELAVPDSAVVYTGPRRIVFVDLGKGRLAPREVTLGAHADGYYVVRSGLAAGEMVVSSGTFLIASESRLKSAASMWEGSQSHGQ